jgi:hypothetical protein
LRVFDLDLDFNLACAFALELDFGELNFGEPDFGEPDLDELDFDLARLLDFDGGLGFELAGAMPDLSLCFTEA